MLLADVCDLTDAFAHERLCVERALAGEHKMGTFHPIREARVAFEDVDARFHFRAEKAHQTVAQSTGGACSGCKSVGNVELRFHHGCESREAAFRKLELSDPFLRSIDVSAARRPKERILHIDGNGELVEESGLRRGPDEGEVMEFRPPNDVFVMSVEELPAESSRHSEPAIVGGAPADANDAAPGSVFGRVAKHRAESVSIQFERVVFSRRKHGQPDDARGLDDRGLRVIVPPPGGVERTAGGVHRLGLLKLRSDQFADDFTEAIAAVTHREQGEHVLRTC